METFNEYQEFTHSKAVYNMDVEMNATVDGNPARLWMPYAYPTYAIAEEAGEVCGKIAKFIRKSNQGVSMEQVLQLRDDVAKELGDLLFQVSETARMFGFTLQEIAERNETKLNDRQERGVLVGEGDDR